MFRTRRTGVRVAQQAQNLNLLPRWLVLKHAVAIMSILSRMQLVNL